MLCKPFIRMVALSLVIVGVGCAGGAPNGDPARNTEVTLLISDPETAIDELLLLIDFVSYRITCADSSFTPDNDSLDVSGEFEVNADANPPVWEIATDLPLSECTIALWVFYEEKLLCSGRQVLSVVEDGNPFAPNKADIVLECSFSVDTPDADVDIDGAFDFVHGNYCPKLVWLGAVPSSGRSCHSACDQHRNLRL